MHTTHSSAELNLADCIDMMAVGDSSQLATGDIVTRISDYIYLYNGARLTFIEVLDLAFTKLAAQSGPATYALQPVAKGPEPEPDPPAPPCPPFPYNLFFFCCCNAATPEEVLA